jgi:glutaredoxin 3
MTAKVEIYTKFACPYCERAKALFNRKQVKYHETDVSGGGPKHEEMVRRAPGATTVPQIFIDGVSIGGSDDLYELEEAGRLDGLLVVAKGE